MPEMMSNLATISQSPTDFVLHWRALSRERFFPFVHFTQSQGPVPHFPRGLHMLTPRAMSTRSGARLTRKTRYRRGPGQYAELHVQQPASENSVKQSQRIIVKSRNKNSSTMTSHFMKLKKLHTFILKQTNKQKQN